MLNTVQEFYITIWVVEHGQRDISQKIKVLFMLAIALINLILLLLSTQKLKFKDLKREDFVPWILELHQCL